MTSSTTNFTVVTLGGVVYSTGEEVSNGGPDGKWWCDGRLGINVSISVKKSSELTIIIELFAVANICSQFNALGCEEGLHFLITHREWQVLDCNFLYLLVGVLHISCTRVLVKYGDTPTSETETLGKELKPGLS